MLHPDRYDVLFLIFFEIKQLKFCCIDRYFRTASVNIIKFSVGGEDSERNKTYE